MKKKKKKIFPTALLRRKNVLHNGVHPPTLPLFSPTFIKGNPGGFAGHFYFAQKLQLFLQNTQFYSRYLDVKTGVWINALCSTVSCVWRVLKLQLLQNQTAQSFSKKWTLGEHSSITFETGLASPDLQLQFRTLTLMFKSLGAEAPAAKFAWHDCFHQHHFFLATENGVKHVPAEWNCGALSHKRITGSKPQ